MKARNFLGFGSLYRAYKRKGLEAQLKSNTAQLVLHESYLEIIETISDIISLTPKDQSYFFNLSLDKLHKITGLSSTIRNPLLPNGKTILSFLKDLGPENFETLKAAVLNYRMYSVKHENVENLVFAGGGAKGMAYPGVLSVLDRPLSKNSNKTILTNVKAVAGASAGALTALPLALGLSAKEVQDIVVNNDFGAFFSESCLDKGGIRGAMLSYIMKRGMGGEKFRDIKKELRFIKAYCEEFEKAYSIILLKAYNFGKSKQYDITKDDFNEVSASLERHAVYRESLANFREHFAKTSSEIQLRKLLSELDTITVEKQSGLDFVHEHSLNKARAVLQKEGYSQEEVIDLNPLGDSQDSAKYVLRSSRDKDNIEGFFGDIIEKRLDAIPEEKLEDVVPELTIQQDQKLFRDIKKGLKYITEFVRPLLDEVAPYEASPVFWKRELMSILRNHELNKSNSMASNIEKMQKKTGLNSWQAKSVIDSLSEMPASVIQGLLNDSEAGSQYAVDSTLEAVVTEHSKRSYRAGAKRNMTFEHLRKLALGLPQYGFKDLYITMCEDKGAGHALKAIGKLKNPLVEKYSLIEASYDNAEFKSMPIKKSARFSMNLPLVFDQLEYKGRMFVDGGVKNNLPKNIFHNKGAKTAQKTLVFMFGEDDYFKKSHNFKRALYSSPIFNNGLGVVQGIKSLISRFSAGLHYQKNTSYKEISGADMWKTHIVRSYDVGTTSFIMSRKDKLRLIERAEASMMEKMEKGTDAQRAFLQSRQEILIEEYAKLEGIPVSKIDVSKFQPDEKAFQAASKNIRLFAKDIELGMDRPREQLLTL